jgi:DNA-binding transcriptional regulator YdaS (Cro superfamily)
MSLSLLKYCEHVGVTIAKVARDAGLNDKWLYKVAKGERGFSPETAAKIEQATGGIVTPSDLNKVRMEWLAENPPTPQKKSLRAALVDGAL